MALLIYKNLREALDSLGEGEALCTDSYLTLFPLTIVYKWDGDSGKYLGVKLVKGRIARPDILSYSKSKSKDHKFGIGQVYVKSEGGYPFQVDGLSGKSLDNYYRLAIFRSEELLKGAEELYSSIRLNKSAFMSYFYDFVTSGLMEIKSIGGDYIGLGAYTLSRGQSSYWKSSFVFQTIRDNITSSLDGVGVDFKSLDHTPIEKDLKDYLSLVSEREGPVWKLLLGFVDRDLGRYFGSVDHISGVVGRIVANKWFDDRGLTLFDVEGSDHLVRFLSKGAESMGITKSREGIKALKQMLPSLVGKFMVSLSPISTSLEERGDTSDWPVFKGFVAVPIGHRLGGGRRRSKNSFEGFEVDYLIFYRMRVKRYEVEYFVTRLNNLDNVSLNSSSTLSPVSHYDLVGSALSEIGRGVLSLVKSPGSKVSRLGGNLLGGSGESREKRVFRAVVDVYGDSLSFKMKNKHKTLSSKEISEILKKYPDTLFIDDINYSFNVSKTYYLDFEMEDDFRLRLIGFSDTEPRIQRSSLFVSFYAGKGLAPKIRGSSDFTSIDCSESGMMERVYKIVENLQSFIESNSLIKSSKEYVKLKDGVERKLVLYYSYILEELKKVLNEEISCGECECYYSWYNSRFMLKIPNFGASPSSPGFPSNLGRIFKQEDFDSPLLRYLGTLYKLLSKGQELCAKVGEDSHRFLFRGGLGDVDFIAANILGRSLDQKYRSEVKSSRSKFGLKDLDPALENFSWSLSGLIPSTLLVFEKDNFINFGTLWLEPFVKVIVEKLVSVLTENRERYYSHPEKVTEFSYVYREDFRFLPILDGKNFIRLLESVHISVVRNVGSELNFSCDDEGRFVPKDIEVSFIVYSNYNASPESVNLLGFYLPSGIPGKSLRVGIVT